MPAGWTTRGGRPTAGASACARRRGGDAARGAPVRCAPCARTDDSRLPASYGQRRGRRLEKGRGARAGETPPPPLEPALQPARAGNAGERVVQLAAARPPLARLLFQAALHRSREL